MVDVAREHVVPLEAVARKLGVSLQTVRNWSSRPHRRLETVRAGRLVRTSWEAVQRFVIDTNQESPVSQTTTQTTQAHEEACELLRREGFVF